MIISDLNYLEVATEATVVGGLTFNKALVSNTTANSTFTNTSVVNDIFNKYANISIKSSVTGNSGSVAFDNEAVGNNTNTQAAISQLVVAGQVSSQSGLIVAAAN
ncbi:MULTISPECIES: hypothetical protein [Nostocales]|uniref:Uncharacterized protein n=3 Tax=Nostocales TaxID=1161 RepID=A0A0C1N569_9CYAN|nr:hypothetical protein [Tolypothrix bouteillei]KAF3888904.1 hypothetical protein DA73_0400028040 [Tolypothrix bouteillei VB521301]